MSLLLYRVDDRLVHGQVIIGWGRPLGIDFILLVDDQVRESPWEQDLYRMGMPAGMELHFASAADIAATGLGPWLDTPRRGILLVGEIPTLLALGAAGVTIPSINLGGIHHKPGRSERLPYLYLTDVERRSLDRLEASGSVVTAQDLPTTTPVPLRAIQ
jgi:PTS system mannose-specific IIB component/fructoselysine and glucoselysine-specific PTS system IIB component